VFEAVLAMRPREPREFLNSVSTGLVVGPGLGGALPGGSWGGPVGAVIGLGVGATAGGLFAETLRFFRR
jgi:hypothetical protein